LLGFHVHAFAFAPWGFHTLEIDRDALTNGVFALTAAAGIFPDGLAFEIPQGDPQPAPKPLEGCWAADQVTLDVHLAVPEYRLGAGNVSSAQRDRGTRYLAEMVLRRDENTGLAERPIQVARKNLRLLVDGESLEGNSALRVARIRRTAGGAYQLDPGFVPPVLDIAASEQLLSIGSRLVEILAARSTSLAAARRQKHQSLADFTVTDVASFWLLYTVNTHLPRLMHLCQTRRGHPEPLYAAMLELAGALTTFAPAVHPRSLPAYDHAELGRCFGALDATIRELLEAVIPSNCVSLPLTLVRPFVYATAIDDDRLLAASQVYLAVSAATRVASVLEGVPSLVKLSAGPQIEQLIRQALPGVPLAHVPVPPSAVPMKVDHQYFQLATDVPGWAAITRARNLAAYVPSDLPDPQLELVIVLPSSR
jgi:type VI secretion system protein ImpJ